MRRIGLSLFALLLLAACNNDSKAPEAKKEETPGAGDITQDPNYQKGTALFAQSDCKTCHSVEDKINGPSFREIATKYAGLPDTIVGHLAQKIIDGGSGVWGEIPMTAHPGMPKEDAETMVRYVLLFKK